MTELTPQQVDCIMYNLRQWRRLVNLIEPRTSASVVTLPVATSRHGSTVERAAVHRAVVSDVLDRATNGLITLPRGQQTIARMRYGLRADGVCHSIREIADYLTKTRRRRANATRFERVSTATVQRKLEAIRKHLTREIGTVSREFWRAIETLEVATAKQTC